MTAPVADQRSRTVRWSDPLESAERLAGLSGLDAMQALVDGTVAPPPIAVLLGFRLAEVEEGRALFTGEADEFHYNPIGAVHGGLAATLLDSAMGCAVHTTLRTGEAYTTAELKVNLVRAIGRGMALRCEGTVLYKGRRQATAEGRLLEAVTGKLLAHGTTTCLVI
ncbi:MAG TPA: PaaI family thioesterase [Solirubrobacteraceae bacterium]|jgi:uncharacterized protein (TIGR00369 family)|nr:PaaI family thioesterase [Solirubrobacteraceae bacterium]